MAVVDGAFAGGRTAFDCWEVDGGTPDDTRPPRGADVEVELTFDVGPADECNLAIPA